MNHAHEPDGINDALASQLRVALTAAGQLAERAARARQQAAQHAQAASEHHARQYASRLDAERALARAAVAPVHASQWWEHATLDDIAHAWETARSWQDIDPAAHDAAEHISQQLRDRYQLDTRDLRADPEAVRAALSQRERSDHDAQREHVDAAALLSTANHLDAAADRQRDAEISNRELAQRLEGVVDPETLDARVLAARNQARPASEAVTSPPERAPRARPTRGPSRGRAKDRSRGR
jgi:hypothetical protein